MIESMRIFVTGGSGLIGRRLVIDRLERGDAVVVLSRDGARAGRLFAADVNPNVRIVEGDPVKPGAWMDKVAGCDAVINLAGAGVADRRWTDAYKRVLRESRIESTRNLASAIARASTPPHVVLTGSAVGYYGDRGDAVLDETDSPGPASDFLASLCVEWEAAAAPMRDAGARVVALRTGVVLDERGGALPLMMRPFRWFAGGWLGNGRQYLSWIHWRDVLGLIDLALRSPQLDGAMNVAAPEPATNRAFSRALGRAMGRPTWAPAPAFALRALVGEMADSLLSSQRAAPRAALDAGYHFLFPGVEGAIESLLDDLRRRRGDDVPDWQPIIGQTPDADPALSPGASVNGSASPATRRRAARPVRRIRLLAIDVDGTLLRSDGRIAQGVIDACRAAVRAGCVIVPATARPPRSMQTILQTLGTVGPTINYNGAVIWNPVDRVAQYHESIDPALARSIIDDARALVPDVVVSVEILDRWFTDRVDPHLHTETSRVFEPDYVGSFDSFLTQPVTKLMLLAPPEPLAPVLSMVRERYWSQRRVAVFITDPHIIQIANPMVDKSIALQRIATKMGADREEVMAIGDGPNDAGMIEWAGFSAAMENACDLVKNLADVVVPSNDALGVAKAIQRYVLS
jgi:uncharacterized protein (TIGR01777 family)